MLEELAVELKPQSVQVASVFPKPEKKNLAPLAKRMYLKLEHVSGLAVFRLIEDGYSAKDVIEVACTNPAFYFDEDSQAVSLR